MHKEDNRLHILAFLVSLAVFPSGLNHFRLFEGFTNFDISSPLFFTAELLFVDTYINMEFILVKAHRDTRPNYFIIAFKSILLLTLLAGLSIWLFNIVKDTVVSLAIYHICFLIIDILVVYLAKYSSLR